MFGDCILYLFPYASRPPLGRPVVAAAVAVVVTATAVVKATAPVVAIAPLQRPARHHVRLQPPPNPTKPPSLRPCTAPLADASSR